ncbi:MAG: universal stress protein E [Pseudohongiellaceae bacterium]|jgi:universal stress protein E
MNRFSKILVTVDVTAASFGAPGGPGPEALALADVVSNLRAVQQTPAHVTVITVIPEGHDQAGEVLEAARKSLVERFVPQLASSDDVEVLVKTGVPFVEVIHEVVSGGHDLVVVAARQSDQAGDKIVSHMATQLIRKCPCPVWVAPRRKMIPGEGSVLSAVALNHGPSSDVLQLAASVAALTKREWNILHVPEYPLEGGMRLRNVDADEVQTYENECREKAWAELHALTDELAEQAGVKPKMWMSEGRPSDQIVQAEEQLNAALIVLGTVAKGGLAGVLIGSTAERTIAAAKSSVLAVKPNDFVCPIDFS